MRLSIIAIAFAVTLGGLFLFENYKSKPSQPDFAQIIRNIQKETRSPVPKPTKTPKIIKPKATKTPSPTATPKPVRTSYTYYTSSYQTAKYYYCDTDSGWKTLSPQTRKSFSLPEDLLKAYPNRTLHEPCKN